jgi:cytochrome c-type biogenesis protein CcmH/NrfG
VEPRSAQAYAMLGSLYFTINWKNLAVKYWEMSLELDPDNNELEDLVAEIKNSG